MKRIEIDVEVRARIMKEYSGAPYGERDDVLSHWASRLGFKNPFSLRNKILYGGATGRAREFTKAEIDLCSQVVAARDECPIITRRKKLPWSVALKWAEDFGYVPPKAVSVKMLSAFEKLFALDPTRQPYKEYRRLIPNQLHHVDCSRFTVLEYAGSNELGPILTVRDKSKIPYLNREEEGLRVWIVQMTDDASSAVKSRFFISRGESTDAIIEGLGHLWNTTEGTPIWGIPDQLHPDQASAYKPPRIQNLFKKLGVQFIPAEAGNSGAKGKVERPFLTIKDWAGSYFGLLVRGTRMTLDKANAILGNYIIDLNSKQHPQFGGSRLDYWRNHVERLEFPENYTQLAYDVKTAVVRRGRVRFEGGDYWAPDGTAEGERIQVFRNETGLCAFFPERKNQAAWHIELAAARVNQAPPVRAKREEVLGIIDDAKALQRRTRPGIGDVEEVFKKRIEGIDLTPPPATARRKPKDVGTLMVEGEKLRRAIFNEIGLPLRELRECHPLIYSTLIEPFLAEKHSLDEIGVQTNLINKALSDERLTADKEIK